TPERTLIPAILPPGAAHIDGVVAAGGASLDLSELLYVGLLASLPYDFIIRSFNKSNIYLDDINRLPKFDDSNPKLRSFIERTAGQLICQTRSYAPLWNRTLETTWTVETPGRSSFVRRSLLVELDVLSTMSLGLVLDELIMLYQTQFPVLRNYERNDLYDVNGRKVPNHIAREYRKHGEDLPLADRQWVHPQSGVEYTFVFPFRTLDREQDYRDAWAKFEKELG